MISSTIKFIISNIKKGVTIACIIGGITGGAVMTAWHFFQENETQKDEHARIDSITILAHELQNIKIQFCPNADTLKSPFVTKSQFNKGIEQVSKDVFNCYYYKMPYGKWGDPSKEESTTIIKNYNALKAK